MEENVLEEKLMLKVAHSLIEDYIHVNKMKNFCHDHKMPVSENKADLIKRIIEYAGDEKDSEAYIETYKWILDTIKSGSKEFCVKRIYVPNNTCENIEQILNQFYSDCPQLDILSFKNNEQNQLVNYNIIRNECGIVSKVSFVFSRLVLEGDRELELGHKVIYPLYIDLYIKESFVIARYKPKTTIYLCSENDIIFKKNKIKPIDEMIKVFSELGKLLKIQDLDINPMQRFNQMMYKLYSKYSFVPKDINDKIISMKNSRDNFIDLVFHKLDLKVQNMEKARIDLDIFLEKYISINGNMEKIFKEDRDAYLIKIMSDDILQMTRIDTASIGKKPLQCSDTFFDGKKSILNTKECKKLNLCYNRKKGYLESFTVQFSALKGWGIIKMHYVPEEEDIQSVLQTIFENY